MGKYIDTPASSLDWLEGDLMDLGCQVVGNSGFGAVYLALTMCLGWVPLSLLCRRGNIEVQRGLVTCSISKWQSWDINGGHLSTTPWSLVRMAEWTLQLTKPHSPVMLKVSDHLGSSSRKEIENKKEI